MPAFFFLLHHKAVPLQAYKKTVVWHFVNAVWSCVPALWNSTTLPMIPKIEDIKLDNLTNSGRETHM